MTYETIKPPFTLKFREMPKKELKAYFDWFQDVLPRRVAQLASVVTNTPGFEHWDADFSPGSLDLLGEWFFKQVGTRSRTNAEISEIQAGFPSPIEIPSEELTDRSFSLAMDIGMYLSQVLQRNHPALRWDQIFGNKRFIDYGQPVLVGFGNVPFNPVYMMVTLAYGMTSKKKDGTGLRRIYEIWSKLDER